MMDEDLLPETCDTCNEPSDELCETLTGRLKCISCWANEEAEQNEPTLAG